MAQQFSELGRLALEHGTKLSYHPHRGEVISQADEARDFFDRVEPGTVGLTLDTAHWILAGNNHPHEAVIRFKDVLDNIHLKDVSREDFAPLGTGTIDFRKFFQALNEIDFNGWLAVDEECGMPLAESLQSSREFILAHTRGALKAAKHP